MTAMEVEPTPTTLTAVPDWEPVVPTPRQAQPPTWWAGTAVPPSALAERARLITRIRELEQLVYETRVELTGLRHHIHDVTERAGRP